MSEKLATLLSYVFHPVWFPSGLLIFYLACNPIAFGLSAPFEDMVLVFQTLITCLILPLVSLVVMRRVGLRSSLHMEQRLERIGPYVAMLIFLLWYYLNGRQYGVAPIFRFYILGSRVSPSFLFMANRFL